MLKAWGPTTKMIFLCLVKDYGKKGTSHCAKTCAISETAHQPRGFIYLVPFGTQYL